MPIKCAGPPQKALYLSADYRNGALKNISIGAVLFGVKEYALALMVQIEKYKAGARAATRLLARHAQGQEWLAKPEMVG